MKRRVLDRLRNQRGVAMVTVLFVATTLTVVSSAAAFITIKEFRAGSDDRRGAEALAYAESGVDRLMLEVRLHTWGELNEAGCKYAPIFVPKGNLGGQKFYNAFLTVYDPNLAAAARLPNTDGWDPGDPWTLTANDSTAVCTSHAAAKSDPDTAAFFAITSTGEHPTAARVVRQIVKVKAKGLPVGLYADTVNVQGGNPSALNISLVTPGDVQGREKLEFTGYDPYYELGHFWAGADLATAAPAAVHAIGTIYCSKCGGNNVTVEHTATVKLNCSANAVNNGHSQWDQSGAGGDLTGFPKCPAWAGTPAPPPAYSSFGAADLERARPTPKLTEQDMQFLKAAAKSDGIYCPFNSGGSATCTYPGGTFTTNGTITSLPAGLPNNFIGFFDFPSSGNYEDVKHTLTWKAPISPVSCDPALHHSAVMVIRYGSLDLTGKGEMSGFFLAPEGKVWIRGSGGIVKIHGTVIAKSLDMGGNAEVVNSVCWVQNMPGPTLSVLPQSWSEVDR